jgi:hypothetical protein
MIFLMRGLNSYQPHNGQKNIFEVALKKQPAYGIDSVSM